MGSRSGDIDPAIVFHLAREAGLGLDDIDAMLNYRSGLRGLCGDNDMREVIRRRDDGDPAATLAFDVYCARVKSYVGAYYALLGRLDAVTFTAGVGENSAVVRAGALSGLEAMGIGLDTAANESAERGPRRVSPGGAAISVCVVPTDEELEIATQTEHLLTKR